MNKMKRLLLVCAVGLIAVACNKNQKAVKKLDGVWEVTSIKYTEDGTTEEGLIDGYSATLTFDGCKLKKDEFCGLTTVTSFGGDTETDTQVYRVVDDGETLETKENATSTSIDRLEIVELDKENLKLKEIEDDEIVEITLKKK